MKIPEKYWKKGNKVYVKYTDGTEAEYISDTSGQTDAQIDMQIAMLNGFIAMRAM